VFFINIKGLKMKFLGNGVFFVVTYVLLMIPTYLLPWLGSNSSAAYTANALGADQATGGFVLFGFWLHLAFLIGLIAVTWFRGKFVGKQWLIVFPFIAMVFDLVTGLNWIPFVPTIMHLLAIILGASAAKVVVTQ